jgi:hypothetical protein
MNAPVKLPELPLNDKPALPVEVEALIAKHTKPSEPDFWDDMTGVVEVLEQPRTAVYWTQSGHVGIRQQQRHGDDDIVVLIVPEYAEGVANAILAVARDIIAARGQK